MTKKLKRLLKRILLGATVFGTTTVIVHSIPQVSENIRLILYLIAYFIIGYDIVKKAIKNIGNGQVFDENFLMTLATVGAFLIGEYPEAVAVMLFYQVGELFQSYAVNRSRKSISELMNIRPDFAWRKRNGEWEQTDPSEILVDEIIFVKPGEKIPLDGIIVNGRTSLDTMALTGESCPRDVSLGDEVISGCININGVIEIQVTRVFQESTVAKILDLVENASSKKAEAENFITKFARYYTPIVVICAVLLAIIPPLVGAGEWTVWVYRALSFLVISCPCALVISIPLSFFGGLGGASKKGILIKGSNYLEALANINTVVMDKTGTLTKGNFHVTEINTNSITEEELRYLTAHAEIHSNHPIALSLKSEYPHALNESAVTDVEELAGFGCKSTVDGKIIFVGNEKLMKQINVKTEENTAIGTIVYVASEEKLLGSFIINDEMKEDAKTAVDSLKEIGVNNIIMLTGDQEKVAYTVAKNLGIGKYAAQLLPSQKVEKVEELLIQQEGKGKLAFVGDGVNDAPVLARADIGIAMGGLGSDAAIEAADVVIMTDEPSKISQAIQISKRTLVIVKENIVFAIGIKVAILLLAAFGIATMWLAIFADVGVAVIAILNAMRALRVK